MMGPSAITPTRPRRGFAMTIASALRRSRTMGLPITHEVTQASACNNNHLPEHCA
jgi:hypothetical protein